jgi:hypothetical protein
MLLLLCSQAAQSRPSQNFCRSFTATPRSGVFVPMRHCTAPRRCISTGVPQFPKHDAFPEKPRWFRLLEGPAQAARPRAPAAARFLSRFPAFARSIACSKLPKIYFLRLFDNHVANPIFEPEKCKAYIAYTCKMCILNNKVRAMPACYKKHAALEKCARVPLLPQPMMTPACSLILCRAVSRAAASQLCWARCCRSSSSSSSSEYFDQPLTKRALCQVNAPSGTPHPHTSPPPPLPAFY